MTAIFIFVFVVFIDVRLDTLVLASFFWFPIPLMIFFSFLVFVL